MKTTLDAKLSTPEPFVPETLNDHAKLYRRIFTELRINTYAFRLATLAYVRAQADCPSEAFQIVKAADKVGRRVLSRRMSRKSFLRNLEVSGIRLESIRHQPLEVIVTGHGVENYRVKI